MCEPPDTSVAGLGRTTPSSVPHGRPPTSPENSQTQALSPTTCAGRSDADPPSASSAAIEERCAVGQLPAHAEPSTNANQPRAAAPDRFVVETTLCVGDLIGLPGCDGAELGAGGDAVDRLGRTD